ncbi:hypothetical protein BRDID11002_60340 [Bradyrhizobium diazoefficiens]
MTVPASDHFNGLHFFDPDGAPPKPLREVLRWQFSGKRQRAAWPDWAPSPHADTPPERVDGGKARLSFVGHASWLIQAGGLNILVDPVWSSRVSPVGFAGPKRHNDPGIAFEKLPKIDVVLVSHGHYDHLDIATLSRLAKNFAPRVVTPLGNDVTMRSTDSSIKAEAFDWHDRVELGGGIAVHLVPTRHWTARGLFDRNKALWASFVLETPAGKIYVVCDFRLWRWQTFSPRRGEARAVTPGDPPDRRLRAALVHARPAHESGRCREGAARLRRAGRARASSRHFPADGRGDRRTCESAGRGAGCRADSAAAVSVAMKPGQVVEI